MHAVNPLYIPRNHRVELALTAAAEREDYAPFEELLTVLAKPYEERPGLEAYAEPPPPISALSNVLRHLRSLARVRAGHPARDDTILQ